MSASLLCLVGGCATGQRAALEIRNHDSAQATPAGERSVEYGKVLLRRGQYADAISAFRTALREEAGSAEAHNGLAIAYDSIGRKDLARRYFELAVAERPDDRRYRNNLASFFEGNGQPDLATGLRDAPVQFAAVEPQAVPMAEVELVPAKVEPVVMAVVVEQKLSEEDPIAAVLAELSAGMPEPVQFAAAEEVAALPTADPAPAKAVTRTALAVFRPTVTPAIKAAPIELPPAPHRDPLGERSMLVADLPRSDRRQPVATGPHIERVSLGEVKLVTQPVVPARVAGFDLDHLQDQLTQWAHDEKRNAEYQDAAGLKGRLAIQNAVERAAMDDAIASAVTLATLVEQVGKDFVYVAYDEAGSADRDSEA